MQILRIGISTDVDNWFLDRFPDGDARFVWSQVYGTLVRLTPDLELTEGLATDWESGNGGKSWVFTLREGVTFHDGTPFDAEAVAFSYGPDSYAAKATLRPLERVEAIDEHTVRFVLQRPLPLPYYLTHIGWPIMSPSCMNEAGEFTRPIGTGPWMLEEHKNEQEIILSRNDDYWGGTPELEKVIFKVIPEAAARVIGLESGELDMIVKVPETDVARLEEAPGIQVHRKTSTFTDFIQFNCERPPFSDIAVRPAVAHAIDTETLVTETLDGVGIAAHGRPFAPVMKYDKKDLDLVDFDPESSRRLLSEAGWHTIEGSDIRVKDGEPLSALMLVNPGANVASGSRFQLMAQAIQAQLRNIGIDMRIRLLERGAFVSAEAAGEFDMLLRTGFYVWGAYPRHFFLHFSQNEYSHYTDAEYDRLIVQADAAPDEQTRRELYHRLQEQTIKRMPAFYMVHQEKIVATRKTVAGYQISSEPPWLNLSGVRVFAEE
ncbi:MAG: ABC transporter substrate-binding protein [Armatimonadota bacterium]